MNGASRLERVGYGAAGILWRLSYTPPLVRIVSTPFVLLMLIVGVGAFALVAALDFIFPRRHAPPDAATGEPKTCTDTDIV